MPNKSIWNKSLPKNGIEFVSCWPTTPECKSCPQLWLINPVTLRWGILISLCQWIPSAESSLVRVGSLCSASTLSAGMLSSLSLCTPLACYHSLFEFICETVLLGLEDTLSFESDTASGSWNLPPLLHRSLSHAGKGWLKTSHLGLSTPKSPTVFMSWITMFSSTEWSFSAVSGVRPIYMGKTVWMCSF